MTAQVHERLILDGKKISMVFCPPLPENDSRITTLNDDEIDNGDIIFSSACWREYIGTWEIKNQKFYLVNLEGRYKLSENNPIFADWFTGTLRIPQGKMLHYVHMGYGSVFERELYTKIENGIVTKSKIIDNQNNNVNEDALAWRNLPDFENMSDCDDEAFFEKLEDLLEDSD